MVYAVERLAVLSEKAKKLLDKLDYENIKYKIGGGYNGWKECGDFDRIMITATVKKIPSELISQLKINGKMVVPVLEKNRERLTLATKIQSNRNYREKN